MGDVKKRYPTPCFIHGSSSLSLSMHVLHPWAEVHLPVSASCYLSARTDDRATAKCNPWKPKIVPVDRLLHPWIQVTQIAMAHTLIHGCEDPTYVFSQPAGRRRARASPCHVQQLRRRRAMRARVGRVSLDRQP